MFNQSLPLDGSGNKIVSSAKQPINGEDTMFFPSQPKEKSVNSDNVPVGNWASHIFCINKMNTLIKSTLSSETFFFFPWA